MRRGHTGQQGLGIPRSVSKISIGDNGTVRGGVIPNAPHRVRSIGRANVTIRLKAADWGQSALPFASVICVSLAAVAAETPAAVVCASNLAPGETCGPIAFRAG